MGITYVRYVAEEESRKCYTLLRNVPPKNKTEKVVLKGRFCIFFLHLEPSRKVKASLFLPLTLYVGLLLLLGWRRRRRRRKRTWNPPPPRSFPPP